MKIVRSGMPGHLGHPTRLWYPVVWTFLTKSHVYREWTILHEQLLFPDILVPQCSRTSTASTAVMASADCPANGPRSCNAISDAVSTHLSGRLAAETRPPIKPTIDYFPIELPI